MPNTYFFLRSEIGQVLEDIGVHGLIWWRNEPVSHGDASQSKLGLGAEK